MVTVDTLSEGLEVFNIVLDALSMSMLSHDLNQRGQSKMKYIVECPLWVETAASRIK